MSYLGVPPFGQTVRTVTTITATTSQTSFTPTGGYTVGYCDVYYNGIKLVAGTDFTATDGLTVVLTAGATSGAVVEIITYGSVTITDAVRRSGDTFAGAVAINSTLAAGNTTITGNTTTTTLNAGNTAITGTATISGNVVLGTTTISANGGVGTSGQVLTSGATGNAYWSTVSTTLDSVLGSGNTTTKSLTTGALTVNGAFTVSANVNVDSGALFVDSVNNKVGINTTAPSEVFEVAGTDAYIRVNRTNNEPGITFRYNDSGTNRGDIAVTSGGAMYFTAGGYTERMRIDSSGRVTKPYQPAFRVSYSVGSPAAWSSGGRVLNFTDVNINIGNHFDTGTSRFTVPIAGRYLFTISKAMNTQGPSHSIRHPTMSFLVNASANYSQNVAITSGSDLGGGDYQHFTVSMTAIINLAQNDYVQAYFNYNNSPGTLFEYSDTHFIGYLLG